MGKPFRIWFFLVIMSMGTAVFAASPEAILNMCVRDAKNLHRRVTKIKVDDDLVMEVKNLRARGHASPFEGYFDSYEQTCIHGPKAEKIKDLSGYKEVLELHRRNQEVIKNLEKQIIDKIESEHKVALASDPGSDLPTIRARWAAMPKRCTSPQEWDRATGSVAKPTKKSARIRGLETTGVSETKSTHRHIFHGKFSSGRYGDLSPKEHLIRIVCGHEVEGIDPNFSERDLFGRQFLDNDPRAAMINALDDASVDESLRALYRAAIVYTCFTATGWDVERSYGAYLYCLESTSSLPAEQEVARAFDRTFPGFEFGKKNLMWLFKKGLENRKAVIDAFAQVEKKYPRMKKAIRDPGDQARRRHQAWRQKHLAQYAVLDPLTSSLMKDPENPPPDCEEKLLDLRSKLQHRQKPKGEDDVKKLRTGDPLAYQITEGLALCYHGNRKYAKAYLESDAMGRATRNVTEAESVFMARKQSIDELRKSEGATSLKKDIPNWSWGFNIPYPRTMLRAKELHQLISSRANIEKLGRSEHQPAVVASWKVVDDGLLLNFSKYTYVHKYRELDCRDTNQVDHYDISGSRVFPVYRRECKSVGPVKKKKISYQERPVVIPKTHQQKLKKGMWATILDNKNQEGDAAVVELWWQKGQRKKQVVIDGIAVK